MKKIISGDVFIIPNELMSVNSIFGKSNHDKNVRFEEFVKDYFKKYGLVATEFVQVWATSETSENWSCHASFDEAYDFQFPTYLPTYLFTDKKEGEVVEFELADYTIRLTLNQSKYRYARFGNFEKVLSDLQDQD